MQYHLNFSLRILSTALKHTAWARGGVQFNPLVLQLGRCDEAVPERDDHYSRPGLTYSSVAAIFLCTVIGGVLLYCADAQCRTKRMIKSWLD